MYAKEPPNGSTTVIAIPATASDESEVIPKLRQFAWDEPVPRIARNGDDILIDLAEIVDAGALDRLGRLLARPVRRTDPPHIVWTHLAVNEEDG